MDYIIVSLAALVVSALTLFSGFGLGTLLMPVFAIFFPLEIAIASTAIVHLANNLLKVGLLGKKADRGAVLSFGIPGIVFALFGAYLLILLSDLAPVTQYSIDSKIFRFFRKKVEMVALTSKSSLITVR